MRLVHPSHYRLTVPLEPPSRNGERRRRGAGGAWLSGHATRCHRGTACRDEPHHRQQGQESPRRGLPVEARRGRLRPVDRFGLLHDLRVPVPEGALEGCARVRFLYGDRRASARWTPPRARQDPSA